MNNFRGRSREDVSMLQFVRQMRCSPNHLLSMFRREICSDPTIEGYRSPTMGSLYRIISLSPFSLSSLHLSLFFFHEETRAQRQGGDPNPEAVDRECDTRFAMLRCGGGTVKQPFVDHPFVVQIPSSAGQLRSLYIYQLYYDIHCSFFNNSFNFPQNNNNR